MTRPAVFVHANAKQRLGALVAQHALRRNSTAPDRFDVHLVDTGDFPQFASFEGRSYRREGRSVVWRNDDLQSFTPLRFAVPELMRYSGRALVIDPDVFAVGDVNALLARDMRGAAILARQMPADSRRPLHWASSVMLLDCARLPHWNWAADFERSFTGDGDYRDWMWLLREPPGSIAPLEAEWNDFDRLTPATRLLHNTHRRTQPWKTGLPSDFTPRGSTLSSRAGIWLRRIAGAGGGHYRRHPDPAQQQLFFRLLGECLDSGAVTERLLRDEIGRGHLRADALACVEAARAVSRAAA